MKLSVMSSTQGTRFTAGTWPAIRTVSSAIQPQGTWFYVPAWHTVPAGRAFTYTIKWQRNSSATAMFKLEGVGPATYTLDGVAQTELNVEYTDTYVSTTTTCVITGTATAPHRFMFRSTNANNQVTITAESTLTVGP